MPQEKLGMLDKGAWYQLKRHLGLVRPSFPYDGGIYEIVDTAGA